MARVVNSISASGSGGSTIVVVANYSALPSPSAVSGKFYWAQASEGIHLTGMYYSNGTSWEFNPADDIIVVANYSALPLPSTVTGQFFWCSASQGTSWLPGNLGGNFYNKGMYFSNGTTWEFLSVPYQATQAEVIAAVNTDKFVTPNTLSGWWINIKTLAQTITGQWTFTNPIVGTQTAGNNSTLAASTAYVDSGLSGKQDNPNVILNLTDYPTTPTLTTLHVVSSHQILANTLSNNSILKYMTSFDRTGTAGNSSMGIYLDTSPGTIGSAVSGTAQLIAAATTGTTGRIPNFERTFKLASNLLTGFPSGVNSPSDAVVATSALTSTPLTPSTTYYLITAVINNSAADIITQRMTSLTQIK